MENIDVPQDLKYGENPQQAASISFDENTKDPLALGKFVVAGGAPLPEHVETLGWNNVKDLSRGIDTISRIAGTFEKNLGSVPKIAVLIEHGNTASAAVGDTDRVIYNAIHGYYRASFGAFLITNVAMTEPVGFRVRQWMPAARPFAGIAAPEFDEQAARYFIRKSGLCHTMANPALGDIGLVTTERGAIEHTVRGGTVRQTPNTSIPEFPSDWSDDLKRDMSLAWGVCASSASNCITIAKDGTVVANAVGQPERAGACELAVILAKRANRAADIPGAAVASDSFFAFADGLDFLARRKVKAIFATSGSVNDADVAEHMKQFDVLF
ncbi:MAG: hypothetical protein AAFO75_07350, partial [Pseudomonadota bacterium]